MSDIVYGYFKAETKKGLGYVCIRLNRPPRNSNENWYHYSYSFCSPNDQFCRKTARQIADDRFPLVKSKCSFQSYDNLTAKDLLSLAYLGITDVPTWLKKAKKVERHFRSRKRETKPVL